MQGRSASALLPIMAVVLVAFLVIGMALPVLPLHVHHGLGLAPSSSGSSPAASSRLRCSRACGRDATRTHAARSARSSSACSPRSLAGLLYLLSLASPGRRGYRSASCCAAARCSARPRASSSPAASAGALRSPDRRTPDASSRGSAWRCSPRSRRRAGRRLALCARAASARSRPQRRSCRCSRCCSSRRLAPVRAAARRACRSSRGRRRGLDARAWLRAQQRRLRRDDRLQLAPLRRARMESRVAALQRVRGCARDRAPHARTCAGPPRRREGRARFGPRRSDRPRADLALPGPHAGRDGRRARRLWLCAGLSRARRGSGAPRAAAEPRPRDGRLHRLPRRGAGIWQPGARTRRGMARIGQRCSLPARSRCSPAP